MIFFKLLKIVGVLLIFFGIYLWYESGFNIDFDGAFWGGQKNRGSPIGGLGFVLIGVVVFIYSYFEINIRK